MTTADSMYVRIMLSNRSPSEKAKAVAVLGKAVKHALGSECPECGNTDVEHNGHYGRHASYCCTRCNHFWDSEGV